ncbi:MULTISPECIES: anthranilate synthase component II [Paenibacillus]|uniref:Aminodeoxychorismate/anthranilate synthase component II n=1 Tax=Paenibacillus borealis TaxID=160799 RepID=A0ABX3H0I0_PAEBO|nr:aminodeoxychorismate/anthranilate synthase component II [Paenibacillus borealis]OMD42327.1 aminodeoxychorismate/anthranilate synthase component II [Paenibacillus borealis]
MVLLIDNYDSFTYNLYQYIGELTRDIRVFRNDQITLNDVYQMKPDCIIISPGPGRPEDSRMSLEIIQRFNGVIPIFGICLGHQAIGYMMGATIDLASHVVHGKRSLITNDNRGIFASTPEQFLVVRYHSLCIREDTLPECLEVQAYAEDGTIMAVRHKEFCTVGVQFHPESILSEYGKVLIRNFLALANEYGARSTLM